MVADHYCTGAGWGAPNFRSFDEIENSIDKNINAHTHTVCWNEYLLISRSPTVTSVLLQVLVLARRN